MASRWTGPRQTTVPRLLSRPPIKTTPTWSSCCWSIARTWEKARHDGFTPLLMSAQNGNLKVTEILLEKRADINKAAKRGQTPLFHGGLLWPQGGGDDPFWPQDPDKAVTTRWGTALSIARGLGHDEIAALLE